MIDMPTVSDCTVSACSYNHDQACKAKAITIGEPQEPKCDTFFQSSVHTGMMDITAGVGACKMHDCNFNEELECSAPNIKVGMKNGNADCLTFKKR